MAIISLCTLNFLISTKKQKPPDNLNRRPEESINQRIYLPDFSGKDGFIPCIILHHKLYITS